MRRDPHPNPKRINSSLLQKQGRMQGEFIRCQFWVASSVDTRLSVFISVARRKRNAVRRNRLKRLLRAAVAAERAALIRALAVRKLSARVFLVFAESPEKEIVRLGMERVRQDVQKVFAKVAEAK